MGKDNKVEFELEFTDNADTSIDQINKSLDKLDQETQDVDKSVKSLNKTLDKQTLASNKVDKALNEVQKTTKQASKNTGVLESKVKDLNPQTNKLKEALGKLADKFKKVTGATKKASDETDKAKDAYKGLKQAASAYLTIAVAKKVSNEVFQLAKLGATAKLVRKNFEELSDQAGVSADQMLADMKRASLGMVSEMELQQKANQAMISGLDPSDMITAMEFTTKFALSTGTDVAQKMQSVFTGLARGSAQFLDDVGIQVMGSKDVVGDAIDQMKEKMSQFSIDSEDAAIGIDGMTAAIKDMSAEIGESLTPAAQGFADTVKFWTPHISSTIKNLIKMNQVLFSSKTLEDVRFERSLERFKNEKDMSGIFDLRAKTLEQIESKEKAITKEIRLREEALERGGQFGRMEARDGLKRLDTLVKQKLVLEQQAALAKEALNDLGPKEKKDKAKTVQELAEEEKARKKLAKEKERLAKEDEARKNKLFEASKRLADAETKKIKDALAEQDQARKEARKEIAQFGLSESQREIAAINEEFAKKKSLFESHTEEFVALEEERLSRIAEVQDTAAEETLEKRQVKAQQGIDIATQAVNIVQGAISNRYARESREIDENFRKKRETIKASNRSEKEKNKEIEKLDKEAAKKKHEIAMGEWRMNLVMAIANTALGVTKAMTNPFPLNLVMAGLTAAAGAVSIATIASNKPVAKFEEGGFVPGNKNGGDQVTIAANSKEHMTTQTQQRRFLELADGRGANAPKPASSVTIQGNSVVVQGNATPETVQLIDESNREHEDRILRILENAVDGGRVDTTRLSLAAV